MKKLVDIQVIETIYGGNFDLDRGCTGKILLDKDNYFEGAVRDHGTIGDDSFIFGYMYENGNVDFMMVAPDDEVGAKHIMAGEADVCYFGNSFNRIEDFETKDSGVLVYMLDADRTRTVTDDEINKLAFMINKLKDNLGTMGTAIYKSEYKVEIPKQNVKR